jgi:hypothetical protein
MQARALTTWWNRIAAFAEYINRTGTLMNRAPIQLLCGRPFVRKAILNSHLMAAAGQVVTGVMMW